MHNKLMFNYEADFIEDLPNHRHTHTDTDTDKHRHTHTHTEQDILSKLWPQI